MKIPRIDVPTQVNRLKVGLPNTLAFSLNTFISTPLHLSCLTFTWMFRAGYPKALFSRNNSKRTGCSIACVAWAFLLLSFPTGSAYPDEALRSSLLRRSSFGYEGLKLRSIRRRRKMMDITVNRRKGGRRIQDDCCRSHGIGKQMGI